MVVVVVVGGLWSWCCLMGFLDFCDENCERSWYGSYICQNLSLPNFPKLLAL